MTTNPDQREPVDAYLERIWGHEVKPGREARMIADDPAFAADLAARLSNEPLPEGVHAPITHAVPTSVAPVKYVIHVWTHKCSLCQTEHKHSEVFALNYLRAGFGAIVRNMTPISRLEWQVPVDVIPVTTRITAGCFECLDAIRDVILPTLPFPPKPEAILKSSEGSVAASAPGTGARAPKSKTPTTTKDFIV